MQMPFDISVLFDSGRGRPYMPTAGSLTNNHMIQTIICLVHAAYMLLVHAVYHMLHIHPWTKMFPDMGLGAVF